MKFKVPVVGVIEDALVWLNSGAVTSAIVTEIEMGAELSEVWIFPAVSETENVLAAERVAEVAPPPSTAVDIAAIVQTVEEL